MDTETTLQTLAREAVEQYETAEDAIAAVLKKIRSQRTLYEALADSLLDTAVKASVYDERHRLNRRICVMIAPPRSGPEQMRSTREIEDRILMMPIGGKRLGELTGAECRIEAETCRAQALGDLRKAYLLEALGKRLPAQAKVKNKLTIAQVRAMWEDTRERLQRTA